MLSPMTTLLKRERWWPRLSEPWKNTHVSGSRPVPTNASTSSSVGGQAQGVSVMLGCSLVAQQSSLWRLGDVFILEQLYTRLSMVLGSCTHIRDQTGMSM